MPERARTINQKKDRKMENQSPMPTVKDSFSFVSGHLECQVIRDTVGHPMNLDRLFPIIKEKDLYQSINQHHITSDEVMNVMCLLIRMPEQTVLIDTGWGLSQQPEPGKLISILRRNGIAPEVISHVIISHGHPDHIGGNADEIGNPLFPNARYIMFKKEWEFWASVPDLKQIEKWLQQEMHASVRKNLIPLQERFTLVDEQVEFLPGIKFIRAPGHSKHHCIINIASGSEQLLYISDLVHHPVQVTFPELGLFTDFNPEQSRRTRTKILSQAAKTNLSVFACHFPFPGLGRIKKDGGSLTWQPQS
jgi:glyoxylase-like metal-dependent hydrolase (beta-lactamase superfamily II)